MFSKCTTSSWNHKDHQGLVLWVLAVGVVVLLGTALTALAAHAASVAWSTWAVLGLALAVFVVLLVWWVVQSPIRLLYALNVPVVLTTRTPHQLSADAHFPEHAAFERAWPQIRREYTAFLRTHPTETLPFTADSFSDENRAIGADVDRVRNRGWRLVDLKLGSRTTRVCRKAFPTVHALLERHPHVVSCVLSVLDGRTHIPEHVGYSKYILRYMLPLEVPDGDVRLCVNHDTLRWTEGQSLLWDDTFPHMVFNNTSSPRVVLYMDVLRPPFRPWASWFQRVIGESAMVKDEVRRTERRVRV